MPTYKLIGINDNSQKFGEILKRNESVLQLVEAVGNASIFIVDWDNPELDDQHPHQQQVCRELVSKIYCCLHLLWMLSDGKHGLFSTPHCCTLSILSFFQASSCPRSRRKLFKPASCPSLRLSIEYPTGYAGSHFQDLWQSHWFALVLVIFFSLQHSNQPHCRWSCMHW